MGVNGEAGKVPAEVVIAGAGMAGLALALQLGRRGTSVVLVDKAAAPRDKVCGEGLMPLGVGALHKIGLVPDSVVGQDFFGLDYRSRRRTHRLGFSQGTRGRGMRRTALIGALQAAALV